MLLCCVDSKGVSGYDVTRLSDSSVSVGRLKTTCLGRRCLKMCKDGLKAAEDLEVE